MKNCFWSAVEITVKVDNPELAFDFAQISNHSVGLAAFDDDATSLKAFGMDIVTDLCDQLRNAGVPGLHFYTMNQAATVTEICKRLQLAN